MTPVFVNLSRKVSGHYTINTQHIFLHKTVKKCFANWAIIEQGSHCTGKTGKIVKSNSRQGKHREFENFGKTRGI